jgi:tetratricopeptide (TPR) repeat protein
LVEAKDQSKYGQLVGQGIQLFEMQKYTEAREIWLKVNRLYPEHAEVLANIGTAYEYEGQLEMAAKYYAVVALRYGEPWRGYYRDVVVALGLQQGKK